MPGNADFFSSLTGRGGGVNTPPKLTRKKMWLAAAGVALGICLILAGGAGGGKESGSSPPAEQPDKVNPARSRMASEEEYLAGRLQDMLQQIKGAGQVKVTLRLAASARSEYAINTSTGKKTTLEKDQGGGTRTIDENTDSSQLVVTRDNSGEAPVLEKENSSLIAGVLVVAEGAKNPEVRARLFDAVQVALGVEPQKILVLPAEGSGR